MTAAAVSAAVASSAGPKVDFGGALLPELLVEHHQVAAFALAAGFVLWRALFRAWSGLPMKDGSGLHQAATGFVTPAFVMLVASYKWPTLVTHITAHELGLAGLMALMTALGELTVNGEHKSSSATESPLVRVMGWARRKIGGIRSTTTDHQPPTQG